MPNFADVQRELGELRKQLEDLQRESRANADTLAGAIRKTRQQIDANELEGSVRRGRPSAAAKLWDPRAGEFVEPDLATSLISRLRAGDPVGNRMGDLTSENLGLRNILTDARLASVPYTSTTLTSSYKRVAEDWEAKVTAGGTSVSAYLHRSQRLDPYSDPFQSDLMGFVMENWTTAGTAVVRMRSVGFTAGRAFDPTVLPWAVFSASIYKDIQWNQAFDHCSAVTVRLLIRNATDSTDLAIGAPVDFLNMVEGQYVRLSVAGPSTILADAAYFVLEITATFTGTAVGGDFTVAVGNPQIEVAPYQSPTAFVPEPTASRLLNYTQAGGESPELLVARITGEGTPRFTVGAVYPSDAVVLAWGGGSTGLDVDLKRTGAGVLDIGGRLESDSPLVLRAADGTNEGGQLNLLGAGAHDIWSIDNYAGKLRFFTGSEHVKLQASNPKLYVVGEGYVEGAMQAGYLEAQTGLDLAGDANSANKYIKLASGTFVPVGQWNWMFLRGTVVSRSSHSSVALTIGDDGASGSQPTPVYLKSHNFGGALTFILVVTSVATWPVWELWCKNDGNVYGQIYWYPEIRHPSVVIYDPGSGGWVTSLPSGTQTNATAW